jgi:AmiR/NasT family two-component response regulator
MMLHSLGENEAFDLLRRHSQSLNIKLADVARRVIEALCNLPEEAHS